MCVCVVELNKAVGFCLMKCGGETKKEREKKKRTIGFFISTIGVYMKEAFGYW